MHLYFSWDVVKLLGDEALFRFVVPAEYGGVGIEAPNLSIIREELSRVCIQADDTFIMSAMDGLPLISFGIYSPKLAS